MSINKKQLSYLFTAVIIIAAVIVALFLLIRHPSNSSNSAKEYNNSAVGFAVTPPKGWAKVNHTSTGLLVEFEAPSAKLPKPTLSVIATAAHGTLDQYIKVISDNNSKQLKDYKEIGGQRITIGGVGGAILEYSGIVDGYDLRYSELVAIKNGAYYQVTGTTTVSTWPTYHGAIEASLNSVKLR